MRSKAIILAGLVIVLAVQFSEACPKCGYSKCYGGCKQVEEPKTRKLYDIFVTEEGTPPNVVVRYWRNGVEYVKIKRLCEKLTENDTGYCWAYMPKQTYTYATSGAKAYVPYAAQGSTVFGTVNETQTYGQPTYQSYAAAYTTDPAAFMNQAFRLVSQSQSLAQQGQSDYVANATALNAQALNVEQVKAVANGYVAAMSAAKTTPDTVNRTTTFQASTGPAGQIEQPAQVQAFTTQGGVTVAKCAGCHSTNPQAQAAMSFSNLAALSCDQRIQAINAIVSDRMPKAPGQPLTPDEAAAIVKELSQQPVAAGQKF
jgi:cytochrome c553